MGAAPAPERVMALESYRSSFLGGFFKPEFRETVDLILDYEQAQALAAEMRAAIESLDFEAFSRGRRSLREVRDQFPEMSAEYTRTQEILASLESYWDAAYVQYKLKPLLARNPSDSEIEFALKQIFRPEDKRHWSREWQDRQNQSREELRRQDLNQILGAIAGGAATGVLFLRWRHLPVGATLDLGVLPVPLGLFFARLGCMFSGCCYGKTTSSWLGVALPGAGGLVQRRFPAQAIASGVNLAVFLILVVLDLRGTRRGRLAPGSLVWSFFALHCFQRFFLEWLRDTSIPVFLSLTVPQILCAVGFVLSVVILVRINRYPVADD